MTTPIFEGMLTELTTYRSYHQPQQRPEGDDMSLTTDAAATRTALENALHWAEEALTRHEKVTTAAGEADQAAQADASDPLKQAVAAAENVPPEARVLAAHVINDLAAMYPDSAEAPEAAETDSAASEGDTQAEVPADASQDATDASQAPADAA